MSGNSEVIKEFLVGLGFDVDEAGLKNFFGNVGLATAKVTALGVAVTAAAGFITAFVTGVASELDTIADLSARVNASATEILELGHVASLTDSSLEAAMSSYDGLSKAAGAAFMGIGRSKIVFDTMGISVRDQNGKLKNTSVLMQEIGDKIKGLEKGRQLAVLSKLGIDPTMVQALTGNVAELREEFALVYRTAGINADQAAQSSSDFTDSLTRLNFVMDAIRKSVALKFMGQLQIGIDSLRKYLVSNMPQIIASIEPVIAMVLRIAESFISIATRIGGALMGILKWIGEVNDATGGWGIVVAGLIAAWKLLNLSFLATPLGLVLSLIAAIGLLVDDFLTWKEGGDSLIDWTAWEPGMTAAIDGIAALKDVATGTFGAIFAMVKMLVQFLTGDFVGGWATAAQAGQFILDVFNAIWIVVSKLILAFMELTGMAPVFSDAWNKIGTMIKTIVDGYEAFQRGISGALPALQAALGTLLPTSLFGGAQPAVPPLAPSPQSAAAVLGSQQTVSQQTEIVVQGATNPESTARTVAAAQGRVNADLARNMKGGVR